MPFPMPHRPLGQSGLEVPPIGLGTWAIGGLHWGGTDEKMSCEAIVASIQNGVCLIDTAPVYGLGYSEELVGRTLKDNKLRQQVFLASKCGLEWSDDKMRIWRNSSPERIRFEIEESLRRLQTDTIDLYQIHWPDQKIPFADSLQTLEDLKSEGKIRAYGVCNYSAEQLQQCIDVGARHAVPLLASDQPPYNIFERAIEEEILPLCRKAGLGVLAYGALCRGLLSGKITKETEFPVGDIRRIDPKFKPDKRPQYLKAVERMKKLAEKKGIKVGQLTIAWAAQQEGVSCALVGARNAAQAEANAKALEISLRQDDFDEIDRILKIEIKTPVGPEFFAPP